MKALGAVLIVLLITAVSLRADAAKGTATYKGKARAVTVTFKHAYLMKGPEAGSGKVIRRLVLSMTDVSDALRSCQTMMCSDGGIGDGMTVDFDSGPRLNYWFVANDQLVQYSGTVAPTAATLTTDTPTQVTGTLSIDATGAGGPKVQVEFDATLVKELTK